jgi:hypothetical protein
LISTKQDRTAVLDAHGPAVGGNERVSQRRVISLLGETDFADVDGYHQHVQDRPASRATRVGATSGRQMNAVCHDVVRSELRGVEPAGNIDVVIVTPQSEIVIEEEILNQTVGFD